MLFSAEIPAEAMEPLEPSEVQPENGGGVGEDGAGYIFLLNCRTFDIWTYEPAPNTSRPVPNTIEELVALVSAASSSPSSLPFPPNIPMSKLTPDPAGESALARILARDASVIPLLESYFLGYAERAEELLSADAAEAAHRKKWKEAIDGVREYVKEMEQELRRSEEEVGDLRAVERGGRGS